MDKIKSRLTMLGLVVFAVFLAWFFSSVLTDFGETAAAVSGAEDAWGFQWFAGNLGSVFFYSLILCGLGFMVWSIYKARRGN